MHQYEFVVGTTISEAAAKLVSLANHLQETYEGVFNDIQMLAQPGDSAKSVEQAWWQEHNRRAEIYRNSPEYKAQQAARNQYHQQLGVRLGQTMQALDQLDFSNVGALINWLEELVEPSEVATVSIPWQTIVERFGQNGYYENVNLGDTFDENDAENYARWLIGQALAFLNGGYLGVHGVHPTFGPAAQRWHEKFTKNRSR